MTNETLKAVINALMAAIMCVDFAVVPIGKGTPPAMQIEQHLARVQEIRARREAEEAAYTEEELELMACVIYCEAGSDSISDETRRMVGEVVLNRVADERYPDTIEAVLTEELQYGRFYWTGVVWPARASKPDEKHAVERAYECARMVFTEPRLLPRDVVFQAEFVQGTECVVHVPGFWFCR